MSPDKRSRHRKAASKASSSAAALRYSNDREPGISRQRAGKGFVYRDVHGKPIRNRDALARIAALAVPPAYEKVWICADPLGHLQATGHDARGRKQYRYHPEWRQLRDTQKFARMSDFAAALPRLRRRLREDLHRPGLPRERVLAVVVTLLDRTRARIGNREYTRDNGSYGLSTLRDRHARFGPHGRLRLRFAGKGGIEHDLAIDDPQLARIVRRCQQLPGQTLFQYVDAEDRHCAIDSTQVNAYLQDAMNGAFTAKDFRSWGATLHAASLLCRQPRPTRGGDRALQRCLRSIIVEVAAGLRNTPAVCRASYINPLLFAIWQQGKLDDSRLAAARSPAQAERALQQLLRRHARTPPCGQARRKTHRPAS